MNRYIKEHYNVNEDSMEWALLKTSAFYKQELRKNHAEIEIIDSYICCMDIICNQIKNNFRRGIHVLKTYSLCIPYIFICRHLIELILKRAIESKINEVKNGHIILNLWKDCKKIYNDNNLKYYDELIETINMLDNNGEKFRYVKDTKGNEFENKPIFINVELIKTDIKKLRNELL